MTMSDDFDDIYGNKFLGAADLNGQRKRVKIVDTEVSDLREKDGSTKRKYIVWFETEEKALVLNKTNALRLAQAFGKNREGWHGAVVELYSEMTSLGKEGIRLRPVRKPPQQQKPQTPPPDEDPPPFDDDPNFVSDYAP
jgi:hypothetical protein